MRKFSTIRLISLGLTMLTVTLLLAARSLGLIPDSAKAMAIARAKECETLAVQCAVAAGREDMGLIAASISQVAAHDSDITSAAFRAADGKLIYEIGPHHQQWRDLHDDSSTVNQIQVPVFKGKQRRGAVEICFKPLGGVGWTRHFHNPLIQLAIFITVTGFVCFYFYLRRVLRHLDPSAVIPQRVKAILDSLSEGVLVLDNRGTVVMANEAFARTTGRPVADLHGRKLARDDWASPAAQLPAAQLPWQQTIQNGAICKGVELTYLNGPAGKRAFMVNTTPVLGVDGKRRGALATFDDITAVEQMNLELKQSRQEIEKQNHDLQILASCDVLTGAFNRRALFENFHSLWQESRKNGSPLAVIMTDIDHFKSVNDRFGHPVGDQVLREVAAILRSSARKQDIVGRYGGEEFCLVMPGATLQDAELAAENIRGRIEARAWEHAPVTASFGVSGIELGAEQVEQMLDQADKALYAAKRRGRNRVVRADLVRTDQRSSEQPDRRIESQISPPVVEALLTSLAYRDKQTAEHSKRVAALSVALGKELLPPWECRVLGFGALLHDIGKLGIPDSILLKPGPLNQEEWKVMRSHEHHGIQIVSAAFDHQPLTDIVGMHHAWFKRQADHPNLPEGAAIPISARILSIADAFDAMIYERPYRKGRPPEDAFAELRRCAGVQFDPDLVERFIAVVLSATKAETPSKAGHIAAEIAKLASSVVEQQVATLQAVAVQVEALVQEAQSGKMPEEMTSRLAEQPA